MGYWLAIEISSWLYVWSDCYSPVGLDRFWIPWSQSKVKVSLDSWMHNLLIGCAKWMGKGWLKNSWHWMWASSLNEVRGDWLQMVMHSVNLSKFLHASWAQQMFGDSNRAEILESKRMWRPIIEADSKYATRWAQRLAPPPWKLPGFVNEVFLPSFRGGLPISQKRGGECRSILTLKVRDH